MYGFNSHDGFGLKKKRKELKMCNHESIKKINESREKTLLPCGLKGPKRIVGICDDCGLEVTYMSRLIAGPKFEDYFVVSEKSF